MIHELRVYQAVPGQMQSCRLGLRTSFLPPGKSTHATDLITGAVFPDYELSDHTCTHRKLSELTSSMCRQPPLTGISHVFSKPVSMIAALS
jgi:hypothetical protein